MSLRLRRGAAFQKAVSQNKQINSKKRSLIDMDEEIENNHNSNHPPQKKRKINHSIIVILTMTTF